MTDVQRALCRVHLHDMAPQTFVGTVPEWVELLPAGVDIVGRDGRRWKVPDPYALVQAFRQGGRKLVIDWEHASESGKGERAPAAGWIIDMEVRGGALWGRVEWTPEGRADLANLSYRYLSPAFDYQPSDLVIRRISSAGLTHEPNLDIRALNRVAEPLAAMPAPAPLLTDDEEYVRQNMGFTQEQWVHGREQISGAARSVNIHGLTEEQRHICDQMGLRYEDFARTLREQQGR